MMRNRPTPNALPIFELVELYRSSPDITHKVLALKYHVSKTTIATTLKRHLYEDERVELDRIKKRAARLRNIC